MSQNSFTDKWIHSSQDRLPGSFMNENHHTMTHVLSGQDSNRQQAATNPSQQGDQYQTSQQHVQTGQNNQLDDDKFLSQEPKRSVVGTQHDDFQKQQSSWSDDNADNYSRAKDQFPSAGNRMNQQKQQSTITTTNTTDHMYSENKPGGFQTTAQQQRELDYDPDPATRSAFQSIPQPMATSTAKTDAPSGPSSIPESVDSNRAIMNQPLVSGHHDDEDDIQPVSSGKNATETMPATYREGQQQQQEGSATGQQHGFNANATNTAAPTATAAGFAGGAAGVGAAAHMYEKGPLDTSGVNQQQQQQQSSASGNRTSPSNVSPPLRGKYRKRSSTPDHEYAAALPVLQSYVPYAQGVAARANNEARYQDVGQQQAATNRRYSLHGADEQHHGFSPANDPDAAAAKPASGGGRRRSSLAESIGRIFRRNSGGSK
ncbi:unnamed protein product [Absidia cylindrospora]